MDKFEITLADLLRPAFERRRRAKVRRLVILAIGAFALVLAVVLASRLRADERDVPSSARREIAMRGNMVEHIDGQALGEAQEDLISQAAETPPDDSHKWHLTVLTVGNCRECQQLQADLASSPAFRDWINVSDHQASHLHFHELRYDGDVGRDWGRKLEKFLGRRIAEFPTIVVQPPVSGAFGPHTQIAFMQSGYDGDPEKLTADMARGLGKYIAKLSDRRILARRGGHGQDEELGASPPPFLLAPSNPPATPGLPFPQTIIPPRVAATVEQIRSVCQGVDAEFLLGQINRGATIEEVLTAWQGEQLKRQIEEVKKLKDQATQTPAVTPPATGGFSATTLIVSVLTALIGGGGIFGLVSFGLTMFRRFRQARGQQPILNDGQFAKLIELLGKIQPPAP